jgi:hypothetical protein
MAKILLPLDDSSWYDELKVVSSYYETELENTILSHVETVFPNYVAIPYKRDIYAPGVAQGRAPDLALINKDYSDWWIIEVELGEHDLKHVLSQVEVFSNGNYNAFEVAKYIKSKDTSGILNVIELQKMIGKHQPQVMVIVDEHVEDWKADLEKLEVKICVFQVFKSKIGHRAYRLNGHYPFLFTNDSHCKFIKSPPNILEIQDPQWFVTGLQNSYLPTKEKSSFFTKKFWTELFSFKTDTEIPIDYLKDREVEIDFLGKVSRWKVMNIKNKIMLKAIGANMVDVNGTYRMYADKNFNLYLKPN